MAIEDPWQALSLNEVAAVLDGLPVPWWIAGGQVKSRDTVLESLERMPEAFLGLFEGANIGKMLVRL